MIRAKGLQIKRVRGCSSDWAVVKNCFWKVWRPSSSTVCWCKIEFKTHLTDLLSLSHSPPWWDAPGGLKLQFIPVLGMLFWSFAALRQDKAFISSFLAPTKFVPLSDQICCTWPRLHTNLLMALMQESVSREQAISRWTALQDKHVKSTPYLFTRPLPLFCFYWAKIVHTNISERWEIWLCSFLWQISHLLFSCLTFQAPTSHTLWNYSSCHPVNTDSPLFLQLGQDVVSNAVPFMNVANKQQKYETVLEGWWDTS